MSKVIAMGKSKNEREVKLSMLTQLMKATQHRVPVLQALRSDLQYHFKVEKTMILEEWEKFYAEAWQVIDKDSDTDRIKLSEDWFNKLNYFFYFFGSFYKYNGSDSSDQLYYQGTLIYLSETINFVEGDEEFKFDEFFYKAFPISP